MSKHFLDFFNNIPETITGNTDWKSTFDVSDYIIALSSYLIQVRSFR